MSNEDQFKSAVLHKPGDIYTLVCVCVCVCVCEPQHVQVCTAALARERYTNVCMIELSLCIFKPAVLHTPHITTTLCAHIMCVYKHMVCVQDDGSAHTTCMYALCVCTSTLCVYHMTAPHYVYVRMMCVYKHIVCVQYDGSAHKTCMHALYVCANTLCVRVR